MSFLSTIGKDIKAVFKWLASPQGTAVISTGAAVVTAIDPGLAGIVNLATSWIQKVITTESLAVAAGSQTGSGVDKAAAVINAMQSQIAVYFPAATAAQITNANNAIVAFLNAFETTTATTTTVTATPVVTTGK